MVGWGSRVPTVRSQCEPLDPEAAVEDSVARPPGVGRAGCGIPLGGPRLGGGRGAGLPPSPGTAGHLHPALRRAGGHLAGRGTAAAEVARALGTRHLERRMSREDLAALWPAALAAMDQPSIDGFNTFLVSRAAHEAGLKVVLSGLGGDELFGSYPSFRDVPRAGAGRPAGPRGYPAWRRRGPALAAPRTGRPKLAGLLRHGRTLPGAYFLRRGLFLPEELPALMGRAAAEEGLAPLRSGGGCRPRPGGGQRRRRRSLGRRPPPGDGPLHAQPAPARFGLGLDGLLRRAARPPGGRLAAHPLGGATASSQPAARARQRSCGGSPRSCRRRCGAARSRASTSRSWRGWNRSTAPRSLGGQSRRLAARVLRELGVEVR